MHSAAILRGAYRVLSICFEGTTTKMSNYPPEVVLRPLVRSLRCSRETSEMPQRSLLPLRTSSFAQKRFYRGVVCTELGRPLSTSEFEAVEIHSNQVRINVKAAALSFADILTVQGKYQEQRDPPFTPGTEFAGVMIEAGPDAKKFPIGKRVCGLSWMSGAFAEEVIVNEDDVFEIPDKMTFTQAAGILSSYGTAILALEGKGKIQKGEKLLITAAAGAVGLAALDLAKNVYGAKVIGAAGGPEKCELLRQLGAEAIDYKTENIREKVRSIWPSGVDMVFESVGGDVFKDCFRSLTTDGRLLVIGFAGGKHPAVQVNHLLVKNVSVLGVYWGAYKILNQDVFLWTVRECFKHFNSGKIHPRVSATYPLDQINEAIDFIQSRGAKGKVILVM